MAGLAILGSLLVSTLVAKGRCTRQWALANRRLEAAAAADKLLSTWWQQPDKFPRESSGELNGALSWNTRGLHAGDAEFLGVSIVRLEVFDTRLAAAPGANPQVALVAVDVVLPKEEPGRAE
jgi:hypothetical protein